MCYPHWVYTYGVYAISEQEASAFFKELNFISVTHTYYLAIILGVTAGHPIALAFRTRAEVRMGRATHVLSQAQARDSTRVF